MSQRIRASGKVCAPGEGEDRVEDCQFVSRNEESNIESVCWIGRSPSYWRETGKNSSNEGKVAICGGVDADQVAGSIATACGAWLAASGARVLLWMLPKLRKTAEFNLQFAFPDWPESKRREVKRKMVRNLGWMAAEFARLPKYTKENIEQFVILDGHENFLAGKNRGKGVIYLTGHIGAWELSSFAHALYGFPLNYMARPLDNKPLDALVNEYRGLSGNMPIFKNEAARGMLRILKNAGTVGILADQNTMPQKAHLWIFLERWRVRLRELRGLHCIPMRRWCQGMRIGTKSCGNIDCDLSHRWN